jgi:hypothetical protein
MTSMQQDGQIKYYVIKGFLPALEIETGFLMQSKEVVYVKVKID